jgi:predicted metal-dependent peptidase
MPHWDKVLKEAYTYAKQQGKEPLGMERIIDGLTQGQVPWQSIVRKFIVASLPKDYTYSLPHKRSQLAGFYIPNVKREEIDVCIGIDTSGSISDDEYMEFVSEVVALDNTFKGRINFHIVTCDAEIQSVQDFNRNFDPRALKSRGYGGTMFKPVFEHIREEIKDAKLLVYFTDLYGDEDHLDKSRYGFHTLWVLTSNSNPKDPPFGQWVRLQSRDRSNDRRLRRPQGRY